VRSLLALALLIGSTPALAEDTCTVEAGPNDVVKKTGDIVVTAGQLVEDAIALDGNVFIEKGATVKNAVAFHGDVQVEEGATVTATALSMGGKVRVAKGATVKGSMEISKRGVRLRGEDGGEVKLDFAINGKSLAQTIADEATSKMKGCRLVEKL
jgi:hypothetical protein